MEITKDFYEAIEKEDIIHIVVRVSVSENNIEKLAKDLGYSLLTIFGSYYSEEKLFSSATLRSKDKAIYFLDDSLLGSPSDSMRAEEMLAKRYGHEKVIFITDNPFVIAGSKKGIVFRMFIDEYGEIVIDKPVSTIKNMTFNTLLTSPLFGLEDARMACNDGDVDTSDDFLYSLIHKKIREKVKDVSRETEENISKWIEEVLDENNKEEQL